MKLLIFVILFSGSWGFAKEDCATKMKKFDAEYMKIYEDGKIKSGSKHWKELGAFVTKYNKCLDGAYAEQTIGVVMTSLANDWKGFESYIQSQKPPKVTLEAITANGSAWEMEEENWTKIQKHVRKSCPPEVADFCKLARKNETK